MCISKDKSIRGLRVRSINVVMMILAIALCGVVLFSSFKIKNDYEVLIDSMNDYSECNKAINEFKDSTDYLTNQTRLFSINLDPIFLENYFYEVNFLKRREVALEIIQMSHKGDTIEANLQMALKESLFLQRREMYSMRLLCDAVPFEIEIPNLILQVELTGADKELSKNQKLEKGKNMLFDDAYIASKEHISTYTSKAHEALINTYLDVEMDSDDIINKAFSFQFISLLMLIIVSVLLFILLIIFVLHPLELHIDSILKNTKMKERGSYEMRYIAKAYNNLCEKNALRNSLLQHKAEHDPLTGLINRNAFDQIKNALAESMEPIAYLIIDIDLFKSINDNYGHPIGDEVLKKISSLLMETFRATDYVARIGGDEFAVIMTKFGTSAVDIIQKKIDGLNYTLQSVDDGLPSVSLSVGVAFSDEGYKQELIAQADKALYRVKKGGRCNCSFYKGEE